MLACFDRTKSNSPTLPNMAHSEFIQTVLRSARQQDALTLWHLLSRTVGAGLAHMFDCLAQLIPPPSGVTRGASSPAILTSALYAGMVWVCTTLSSGANGNGIFRFNAVV